MDNVKLTKEQAKAIDAVKDKAQTVSVHVKAGLSGWTGIQEPLNGMSLNTLIRALYNGYEVEQTMEERMLDCYENAKDHKGIYTAPYNADHFRDGMYTALEIAGIKIKGVNDNG